MARGIIGTKTQIWGNFPLITQIWENLSLIESIRGNLSPENQTWETIPKFGFELLTKCENTKQSCMLLGTKTQIWENVSLITQIWEKFPR